MMGKLLILMKQLVARNKPSHLDLHCLQRYLYWCARMKGLKLSIKIIGHKCPKILDNEK